MSEKEHQKILEELQKKYGWKIVKDINGTIYATGNVYVDYRESHQHMNRVEIGVGFLFLDEIVEVIGENTAKIIY